MRRIAIVAVCLIFVSIPQVYSAIGNNSGNQAGSSLSSDDDPDHSLPTAFNRFTIGLSGGMVLFHGDVASYNIFPKPSNFSSSARSGWSVSVSRDIKWGLGAQIEYHKGQFTGERGQLFYEEADFIFYGSYQDLSISGTYDLTRTLFKKDKVLRYKIYGLIGAGAVTWRSQLLKVDSKRRHEFSGYTPVEESGGQQFDTKGKRIIKLVVPVSFNFVYRLNQRADINLCVSLRNTNGDHLDGWDRDWTAKDKYSYTSIGFRYNFNRVEDDLPERSKRRRDRSSDDSGYGSGGSSGGGSGEIDEGKWDLFGGKVPGSEEDELLYIRLKLFETQLKLFEMQYLIQNSDKFK